MDQSPIAWRTRRRAGRTASVGAIDAARGLYAVRDPATVDSLRLHRWALDRSLAFDRGLRCWRVDRLDGAAMLSLLWRPSTTAPSTATTRFGPLRCTPTRRGDARIQYVGDRLADRLALDREADLLGGDPAARGTWFLPAVDGARILSTRPTVPSPHGPSDSASFDGHPVWIRADGRVDRDRYRMAGRTRSAEIGHHLFEVFVLEDGAEVWHDLGAGGRAALIARHGRLPWIDRLSGTLVPSEDDEPLLLP